MRLRRGRHPFIYSACARLALSSGRGRPRERCFGLGRVRRGLPRTGRGRRKIILGFFCEDFPYDHGLFTVPMDPRTNESADASAERVVLVWSDHHRLREDRREGCAGLADRASWISFGLRARSGTSPRRMGGTGLGGGRDTQRGEGRGDGGALDELWCGLSTRMGARGPCVGGGDGGRGDAEMVRKGEGRCTCGHIWRDRFCPLVDATSIVWGLG